MVVKRFDVWLINLDPTVGSEIQKTRPCVVVTPDVMNSRLATFTVAPMTTKGRFSDVRAACAFQGKEGHILLDQLRTVDRSRGIKRLGRIHASEQKEVLRILSEMFAE